MFEGVQSALDPAGRSVVWIGQLAWAALLGGSVVLAIVMLLAKGSVRTAPRAASSRRRVSGGLALSVLALVAVLVYALIIAEAFSRDAPHETMRIEVTPRQSWWEIRYEPHRRNAVLATELRVPLRRPVELILAGSNGASRRVGVNPIEASPVTVIAEEPEAFDEWLRRQAAPSVAPTDPALLAGRAGFFRAGCASCHAIRGTAAHGMRGPDLTHVGAGRALATDALDQHLRTAMEGHDEPAAVTAYRQRELRMVVAYLASLK